jgi:hypothetical protein
MVDVNRLLPPELERLIFEMTAEQPIPICFLLPRGSLNGEHGLESQSQRHPKINRENFRIEPPKYRTFTLTTDPPARPQFRLLQQTVKSKPAQFIYDNIRYLLADENFLAGSLDEILPGCIGIISLFLFHTRPPMVSQLEAMRPRRLSASVASFFVHDVSRFPCFPPSHVWMCLMFFFFRQLLERLVESCSSTHA